FLAPTAMETLQQVLNVEAVPPRRFQPELARDLETICLKCLRKEPRHRYVSAAELAEDLRRFRAGEPILARPLGRIARGWRWCRRNPPVAALLTLAWLLLITGQPVSLFSASNRAAAPNNPRPTQIKPTSTNRRK